MMSRGIVALLAALLGSSCAPRVEDLRLESIHPPRIGRVHQSSAFPGVDPPEPIIILDVSTVSDLRLLEARYSHGTYVDVVLCQGRTHITRQDARSDILESSPWHEDTRPADASQRAGSRFTYSIAVSIRQSARVDIVDGLGQRSFAEVDLVREPGDLCLVIDSVHFGPRWRTNTVVIPAAAIRTALFAAAPRPAEREPLRRTTR